MIIAQNFASKLFVAFVAASMLFTLAMPAKAATATMEELQAQINALMAQLAAAQGSSSADSMSSKCTFTRPLTIGSQGEDVKCLQEAMTPTYFNNAGGATGYFGPVTQAAVAKWQAAVGVSPAAGYFGPLSQAKFAEMMMSDSDDEMSDDEDDEMTDDSDDEDMSSDDLSGEASLDDVDMKSGDDSDIEENQEDVVVAEMDVEFTDGDAMITRIDLALVAVTSGEEDPWDTFEDISLWVDGDEIARQSASDEDDYLDEDAGSIRISGLDIIAEEDETVTIEIAVSTQNGIDNLDATWRVDADAIRYVDGDDVSTTENSTIGDLAGTGTSFDIEEEGGEDELKIRTSSEDPESTTLELEDDKKSDWMTVFAFDLDTEDSTNDIEINELPVALHTSGATSTATFVNDVQLLVDGEEFDDFTVQGSGSSRTYVFEFDSREFVIEAGERVTVEVQVEFNQLGAGDEGTTIYGTASSTDVDAEGADDLTVGSQITGSATGEIHSLRTGGLIVTLLDTDETKSFEADDAGEKDTGEFTIQFKVKAFEDDIYLDRTVTQDGDRNGSGAAGSGFQWATTTDSTTGTTTSSATISASDTDSQDTATLYYIAENTDRTFTLKVNLEAGTDGSAGVMLTGINFTKTAGDSSAAQFHTSGLEDFKTLLKALNII